MTAHVSGSVGVDSRVVRYTRRVDDPRLLAGYGLKALLERAEVKVSGEVKLGTAKGRVLARHLAEPLSLLLYGLGKRSDNFYAEMVFRSLAGQAKGHPARSGDSSELVLQWLGRVRAECSVRLVRNGARPL